MFNKRKGCFALLRNRNISLSCQLSSLKTKRKQISVYCLKVSEQAAPTAQQSKPLQLHQLLLAKWPILKRIPKIAIIIITLILYVYLSIKYISLPSERREYHRLIHHIRASHIRASHHFVWYCPKSSMESTFIFSDTFFSLPFSISPHLTYKVHVRSAKRRIAIHYHLNAMRTHFMLP